MRVFGLGYFHFCITNCENFSQKNYIPASLILLSSRSAIFLEIFPVFNQRCSVVCWMFNLVTNSWSVYFSFNSLSFLIVSFSDIYPFVFTIEYTLYISICQSFSAWLVKSLSERWKPAVCVVYFLHMKAARPPEKNKIIVTAFLRRADNVPKYKRQTGRICQN